MYIAANLCSALRFLRKAQTGTSLSIAIRSPGFLYTVYNTKYTMPKTIRRYRAQIARAFTDSSLLGDFPLKLFRQFLKNQFI